MFMRRLDFATRTRRRIASAVLGLAAVSVLAAVGLSALLWPGHSAPGSAFAVKPVDPTGQTTPDYVKRDPSAYANTVVHERFVDNEWVDGSPDPKNGIDIYADTWLEVDGSGTPIRYAARFMTADGTIVQEIRSDAASESVSRPSSPSSLGVCQPDSQHASDLASLIPATSDTHGMAAAGWSRTADVVTPGVPSGPAGFQVPSGARPTATFSAAGRDAEVWAMVLTASNGATRARTVTLDAQTSTELVWKSVTTDATGKAVSTSLVTQILREKYKPSAVATVFSQVPEVHCGG
jgi:hypothetical protein